jgi:hypothetical protein
MFESRLPGKLQDYQYSSPLPMALRKERGSPLLKQCEGEMQQRARRADKGNMGKLQEASERECGFPSAGNALGIQGCVSRIFPFYDSNNRVSCLAENYFCFIVIPKNLL